MPSRSLILLALAATSCASSPALAPVQLVDAGKLRCPPAAAAPAPLPRLRTVDQLAGYSFAWRSAWERTSAARDACAAALAALMHQVEIANRENIRK